MQQRAEHELKDWITAAEVALLESGGQVTLERFSWLALGLVRRSPEKLWDLLREASKRELDKVPGLESLLEILAKSLLGAERLGEAADLVKAASLWGVRLSGSVYRQLAWAQMRSGETTRAEATIRELLKRDADDVEALRLLYRLLRESGRTTAAHDALNRLVELDPSGGTATFAHGERGKLG